MDASKPATINASDLQRASGQVLKRVIADHETLVVNRGGYPVAVLLPFDAYEALLLALKPKKSKKRAEQ